MVNSTLPATKSEFTPYTWKRMVGRKFISFWKGHLVRCELPVSFREGTVSCFKKESPIWPFNLYQKKITSKSHHHLFWIPGHKRIQYRMAFTYSEPWGLGGFGCGWDVEEIHCPLACPTFTWEIMGRNWTYTLDFVEVPKILPNHYLTSGWFFWSSLTFHHFHE